MRLFYLQIYGFPWKEIKCIHSQLEDRTSTLIANTCIHVNGNNVEGFFQEATGCEACKVQSLSYFFSPESVYVFLYTSEGISLLEKCSRTTEVNWK